MINIFVALFTMPVVSTAQVYNKRMDEAIALADTALQRKILVEWKFEWPDDPDMKIATSRFYQNKYMLENDSVAKGKYLAEAYSTIEQARQDFPDRLDIRFASISLLGDMGRYEEYTAQIIDLLNVQESSNWLWRDNSKLGSADDFVRQYIDAYTLLLYNHKDERLYTYMDTISNQVLQLYPQYVPALLSLSINAMHREDYVRAIEYLGEAKTLEPANTNLLDNLALAYERTGDTIRAIETYEQIKKYGNEQEKSYASRKINELSKP